MSNRIKRTSRFLGLALSTAVVFGGQLMLPELAHAATTYFTSPTGSGTACTSAAPCGLKEALSLAPGGSTVLLNPGSYRTASTAYTETLTDTKGTITISGEAGKARPTIYTNAAYGIELVDGSTLHDVKVISTAAQPTFAIAHGQASPDLLFLAPATAVRADGASTVSHVAVLAKSKNEVACSVEGTLIDSLCVSTGTDGDAVAEIAEEGVESPVVGTIRGVTAIGRGSGSYGMAVDSFEAATINVSATNSIFRGRKGSVKLDSDAAGAIVTADLHYCDYGLTSLLHPSGTTTLHENNRVSAQPVFVNEANLQFGEAANSPTINAGATDEPDTDLLGFPRTLGSAPDIGAYEFHQPPAVPAIAVTKTKKHSLKVTVSTNAEGLRASVVVSAKHKSQTVTTPAQFATTDSASTLTFKVTGLKPHKTYHLQATAKNLAGSVTSSHVKAKTK